MTVVGRRYESRSTSDRYIAENRRRCRSMRSRTRALVNAFPTVNPGGLGQQSSYSGERSADLLCGEFRLSGRRFARIPVAILSERG
jgi:hypothetical protein